MMMMAMKRTLFDESKFARHEGRDKEEDPVKRMRYGDNRKVDKGVPISCDCRVVVAIGTCKSSDGREERYFLCGYDLRKEAGDGCGFKRLVEKEMLDEISIMKVEKAELHDRVGESNKRIDKDKGTFSWMQVQYEEKMADHKKLEDYSGELGETQFSLAVLKDSHSALERKVDSLEKNLDMENMMLRRYGEFRAKDKGVPRGCDCGYAVIVETEKEALNRERKYVSCPYGAVDGGCGFKRWWVQAILDEFEIIKEDKETMSKALEETKDKNEELEERVQAGEDDGTMEHNVVTITQKLEELKEKVEELGRKYEWLEGKYMKLNMYL